MKKLSVFCSFVLIFFLFHSCFVNAPVAQADILSNIRICDNSYIGLLNFCNFSGKIENNNRFKIDNVQLRGIYYNKDTKQRYYYNFKLTVPVTANGSATYEEKTFVGKGVNVERVQIISAEKSY